MSNDDGSQRQSASSWSFSDAGMTLLKSAEALFLQPYDDQTERPTSNTPCQAALQCLVK